jgi:hypothetical protein
MSSTAAHRVTLSLVCAAIAATTAACTTAPNQPAPATNASVNATAAATASAAPKTESLPKVLGPTGLGTLKLGMSPDDAYATGLITKPSGGTGCDLMAGLVGSASTQGVRFTSDGRLSAISAYGDIATPEGVRLGTTVDKLTAAYPAYRAIDEGQEADDRGYADVPGHSDLHYRVETHGGVVVSLTLQSKAHGCYE